MFKPYTIGKSRHLPVETLVLELITALLAEEVQQQRRVYDVPALQTLVVINVLLLRLGAGHDGLTLRQAPLVAPSVAEDLLHLRTQIDFY